MADLLTDEQMQAERAAALASNPSLAGVTPGPGIGQLPYSGVGMQSQPRPVGGTVTMPGGGIGLSAMNPTPGVNAPLTPFQRGADVLGFMGNAALGLPSPDMERHAAQLAERKRITDERQQSMQEFGTKLTAVELATKHLAGLTGDAKTVAQDQITQAMDKAFPDGSASGLVKAFSNKPNFAAQLIGTYGNTPFLQTHLAADPTGASAIQALSKPEGQKIQQSQMDRNVGKLFEHKVSILRNNFDVLATPEMKAEAQKHGGPDAVDIMTLSKYMETHPGISANMPALQQATLTPVDMEAASRNPEWWHQHGLLSPKDASAARLKATPTPHEQAMERSPLAKLQAEREAIAKANPADPRIAQYDTAITHATNPQSQRISLNMGGADKYGNVTPDGQGGYIGLNKTTARMEKIPQAEGVTGPGAYSKDALGTMAWEKLLFGTDPKGMGTLASAQRATVTNERTRLGKSLDLTDTEMAMMPHDNKIKMKAADKLTTWGAFVGKSSDQLEKTIDIAIEYAKKLDQGTLQLVNRGVIAGKKEFNNPNANAYALQVNSIRQEYGRLMSGPTSNAMLPVEAMKKGDELISTGLNVPAWQEIKKAVLRDASVAKTSVSGQIDSLRGSIQNPGRRATDSLPEGIPAGSTIIGKTPDGKKDVYKSPDGKKWVP